MKKLLFPAFLLFTILAIISIQSFRPVSVANEQQLIAKANQFSMQFPQEKLYLHLDRPSYWAGEDIWFKAYLKNSPVYASNLYVDLLNSAGKVVSRTVCWAQDGLSYGDIHLSDTISSGMYQVRAYTNWMRNFDEEQFFRKDMIIWNLRDRAKPSEKSELKAREVDVQFLPEGGTFLAGEKNRIAYKVIDKNGKGLDTEGIVFDEKRAEVARIKAGFKGIGSFELTPEPGMKYTAELTIASNLQIKAELPSAETSGVAVTISPEDTARIHLEIREHGTSSEKYVVIGQTESKVCYRGEVSVTSGKGILDINSEKFPTGIVRLTLFDSNMIPRCERLVFVNHHDQVNVKIEPEKQSYRQRDSVILDLSSLGKGGAPAMANLSMSVYFTETTHQLETYPENILTRFLLSSELKGRIEEPAYYFKDDSLTTIKALDNLMLTHGYRTFTWKEISEDKFPEITHQPDSSIQLGGRVTTIANHSAVQNGKVTLMTLNTLLSTQTVPTDNEGRFLFSGLYFTDTIDVTLHAVNSKGKKNAFIEVDKTLNAPPKPSILPLKYEYRNEKGNKTIASIGNLSPELLNKKWHLSDTILIRDINIVSQKKKEFDDYVRPYKKADAVFEVTKSDNVYIDLGTMLEAESPMWRSFTGQVANGRMQRAKISYFLNGAPVDLTMAGLLEDSPNSFDKIEFVKMAPISGGYGPAVYFYTKRGMPNRIVEEASASTSARLVGYSVIRKFYSPVYDGKEDQINKKGDFRSTLCWAPVIRTNANGLAKVAFYNSDQTGEVKVVLEGVTKDGKLCRGEYIYNVGF